MPYQSAELEQLWERLRGETCYFRGTYLGLREVPFAMEGFAQRHRELVRPERRALVTSDASDVLHRLKGAREIGHHLSCAGSHAGGVNAALCIHYRDAHRQWAVALPGVDYVPDAATAESLKRVKNAIERM